MHDPMVVAFEIRRPWPRRSSLPRGGERWKFRAGKHLSSFWTIAGHDFYWPGMITIWHVEPGGRDSGEVCKHYSRERKADGTWETTWLRGWKWHVRHWKIQVGPLQTLRRWALTRCVWCGGRSRKGDPVNCSHSWEGERGPWWKGEPGLYHADCSGILEARRSCTCALTEGSWEHGAGGEPWGKCGTCGLFRSWRDNEDSPRLETLTLLKQIPTGQRDKGITDRCERIWRLYRSASDPS